MSGIPAQQSPTGTILYRCETPQAAARGYVILKEFQSGGACVWLKVTQTGSNRTAVSIECTTSVSAYVDSKVRGISELWPQAEAEAGDDSTSQRGPTLRIQERADLYKTIKDEHPDWSTVRVAMAANTQTSSQVHSENSVRNAYRAMHWPWERADRVR